MAETIPVAPNGLEPDDPVTEAAESADPNEGFDEDILADIERSLDEDISLQSGGLGEKVELDKADLPLIWDDEEEEEEALEPEEEQPEVEVDLASQEEPPADLGLEEKAPARGKKFWLLVGGAGLAVFLLIGGGLTFLMSSEEPAAPQEEVLSQDLPPYMAQGRVPDPVQGLRYDLKPFIIPLTPSKKGRILRVVVSLEVAEPQAKQSISNQERLCRDVVYLLLRNRQAPDLETARVSRLLHAQIKAQINKSLKKDVVYKVYFTEFVITG